MHPLAGSRIHPMVSRIATNLSEKPFRTSKIWQTKSHNGAPVGAGGAKENSLHKVAFGRWFLNRKIKLRASSKQLLIHQKWMWGCTLEVQSWKESNNEIDMAIRSSKSTGYRCEDNVLYKTNCAITQWGASAKLDHSHFRQMPRTCSSRVVAAFSVCIAINPPQPTSGMTCQRSVKPSQTRQPLREMGFSSSTQMRQPHNTPSPGSEGKKVGSI